MKACIIEALHENVDAIKAALPSEVVVAAELRALDRDATIMRLEGDGLPVWCQVVPGHLFMHAFATVLGDGRLDLVPGSGIPVEQVKEKQP